MKHKNIDKKYFDNWKEYKDLWIKFFKGLVPEWEREDPYSNENINKMRLQDFNAIILHYGGKDTKKLTLEDLKNKEKLLSNPYLWRPTGFILDFVDRLKERLSGKKIRILDSGGGHGRDSIALAKRGYEVTLLDRDKWKLDLAIDKAREEDVEFKIRTGVCYKLPFPNNTFDVVILMLVLFTLRSIEEIEATIKECKRVLKPGGYVIGMTMGIGTIYDDENRLKSYIDKYKEKGYAPILLGKDQLSKLLVKYRFNLKNGISEYRDENQPRTTYNLKFIAKLRGNNRLLHKYYSFFSLCNNSITFFL